MGTSLTELTDEQLAHKVLQAERDLIAARFKHSMNQLENTAHLRVIRREIARLRTEARVRERSSGIEKDSLISRHSKTFGASAATGSAQAEKGGFLAGIVDKLTGKE